jgi:hypothetical protein
LEIEVSGKARNIAENLISHVSKAISASANLESFIGIPLILYMVAEIYKKDILSILQTEEKISFHGPVTLIEIYQNFVDLKLENYMSAFLSANARVKPGFKEILKTLKNKFVNDHELLGTRHLLGAEFADVIKNKDLTKIRELSEEIQSVEDRRGIIYSFQNGTFTFMHQSFAEYFAASWFFKLVVSEDFKNKTDPGNIGNASVQKLKDFFEKYYFQLPNFRKLFDLISAEKCVPELKEIFECAIHRDFDKLEQKAKLNLDLLVQTDPLGRNVQHIAEPFHIFVFLQFIPREQHLALLQKKDNLFSKTAMDYSWQRNATNEMVQLLSMPMPVSFSREGCSKLCSYLRDQTRYLFFCLYRVCDKETISKSLLPKIEKFKEVLAPDLYKQVLAEFRMMCDS